MFSEGVSFGAGGNGLTGTPSRGTDSGSSGGGGPMRRRVSDKCTLPISAGTRAYKLLERISSERASFQRGTT